MSYVLDALKKAQQERMQGADAPEMSPMFDAAIAADTSPVEQKQPGVEARLPVGVIVTVVGLVLLALAVSLYSQFGGESDAAEKLAVDSIAKAEVNTTQADSHNGQEEKTQISEVPVQSEQAPAAAVTQPIPAAKPMAPVAGIVGAVEAPRAQSVAAVSSAQQTSTPAVPQVAPETEPAVVVAAASKPAAAPEPESVPQLQTRTLPPYSSLRKIPTIDITSHLYATDANSRSVTINGRSMVEGEPINADVYLQSISRDGIVINVDGYHLDVSRRRGWQAIE